MLFAKLKRNAGPPGEKHSGAWGEIQDLDNFGTDSRPDGNLRESTSGIKKGVDHKGTRQSRRGAKSLRQKKNNRPGAVLARTNTKASDF